jgi:hypothetical protein
MPEQIDVLTREMEMVQRAARQQRFEEAGAEDDKYDVEDIKVESDRQINEDKTYE